MYKKNISYLILYSNTKDLQYVASIRMFLSVSDKSAHGYIAANTLVSSFISKLTLVSVGYFLNLKIHLVIIKNIC